ncbi:oxygenase MpaB family protein [Actinokineospora iranica]|uniref:Uncharacterized conserved protein, DUF2236 family n=1 Tax=Actinokineospora iranica TaxID=1271860 RepID=A0A1G6XWI7_9PSEU|nr:oxygenase MpaB family protein [Actinokineospora iranica]SDD82392.1 Uncharacterized conserved protein, DUF2236 family [Actinokineospora iranica]
MDSLGPDSATWRVMADVRTALCSGRALLMQVSHPAVGAAVAKFSDFRTNPWPRLWGTVNSAFILTFGGPQSDHEARRLRALHRTIHGVDASGRRYHALNPENYFWVHATLLDSAIAAWRHFATPVTDEERLYAEWRSLGARLGIPPRTTPATYADFRAYVDDMTATALTNTRSAQEVLHALTGDVPPPLPRFPLWDRLMPRLGTHLTRLTLGTLPHPLREKLNVPWTSSDALRFARQADRIRATVSALPRWARQYPGATYAFRHPMPSPYPTD